MPENIRLLLISDSKRFNSNDAMLVVLEQALQGGVDTILLRENHLDSGKLLALAARVRILTHQYKAKLIIHSQANIAQAVDADGVHVNASSITEIPDIRAYLGENAFISASCHNEEELVLAEKMRANFVFLSPVFPTQSHPGTACLGAEKFLQLSKQVSIPVLALGGIEQKVLSSLQGAAMATMGGILDASNPTIAAQNLIG
ncbi:MAG: thiamine phosphate synthase [Ghiorsea sp.]